MKKNNTQTKKFLQKILKFDCPDCQTSYQLIETHSLKHANCGECPAQWKEILQTYHREQCLVYLAENQESKNDDE